MEAVMQMVVRPEADQGAFATRLDATIQAFRLTGATRIEVIQLGRGRVLVMAYRPAISREVREADDGSGEEAGEASSEPLARYFDDGSALWLVLAVVGRADGLLVEHAEKHDTALAVARGQAWSPVKVRFVEDEVASFVRMLASPKGCDSSAFPPFRVIAAALEGLRMLHPAPCD